MNTQPGCGKCVLGRAFEENTLTGDRQLFVFVEKDGESQ